jgi:murein DD-endopeptidase MepM/ murein hydrolase activator NlpD
MSDNDRSSSGTLPDDFVGADQHGPGLSGHVVSDHDPSVQQAYPQLRTLASVAWGGASFPVTSEHGQSCGYCGVNWPTGVGMPAHTHPGMDISMVRGTRLYAAAAGTVRFAGWSPRFYRPHQVLIETPDGEIHVYAHMWSVAPTITAGTSVNRGDYLGTSGEQTHEGTMTPDGTGGHLHFEARRVGSNQALDPEPVLAGGKGEQRFQVGDAFRVTEELNLRAGAGTDHDVVTMLPAGTTGTIEAGPTAATGYTWWQVSTSSGNGWVAQNWIVRA